VDDIEFLNAAKAASTRNSQLLYAAKAGAARELYEETGLDVRGDLSRIEPLKLYSKEVDAGKLENEYKSRLFFVLVVKDADFGASGTAPMSEAGSHLKVRRLRRRTRFYSLRAFFVAHPRITS